MPKLSDRAMLVNLSMSVWNAEREDKACGEAIAEKYGSSAKMGKYRRFLIDPDALKPILKLRGEIRNRHYEITLPWSDDSSRIITTAGFLRYRDEMESFKSRWIPLVEQFTYSYPDLVREAALLLNGLYRDTDYPKPDAISSKFGMGVRFRPVPDAGDFRCKLGDDDVALVRSQIEHDSKNAVSDAMREVGERVKSIVGNMADRLKNYGVDSTSGKISNPFRDSLVENVRELADILPGLNLTADARIDQLIADLAPLTVNTPEQLRDSDHARKETAKKAEAILKRMEEYGL